MCKNKRICHKPILAALTRELPSWTLEEIFHIYACHLLFSIYHINCGIIQGFPALRKAVTAHVKNIVIFHVCLKLVATLKVDKWRQSLHHLQSKVFCGNFFGLWLLKHLNIRIVYWQWRSIVPRGGRKLKVTYSVVSRSWERKSRTGRFATGRFWPFTWKTSSTGKDRVNSRDVLCNENYGHCLFLWCFDAVFLSEH